MAKVLNLYHDNELIDSDESEVVIEGLDPDMEVEEGEYQVSFEENGLESEKVDVPSFRTLPIEVTGVSVSPQTSTVDEGEGGSRNLNVTIEPSNATNQDYSISSDLDVDGDTISWDEELEAGEYVTTITSDDGGHTATHTLTIEEVEDEED